MKIFFFVILMFFLNFSLYADNYPIGAKSTAMANASVTFTDIWALSHNPSAIAFLKKMNVACHFENHFFLKEYALHSALFTYPIKYGNFGLAYTYFGYNLYNEQKISLTYAKSFVDKFAFGISFNYFNTHIAQDYGNKGNFNVDLGILTKLNKNLTIGTHIINLTKSKLAKDIDEKIPTIYKVGLSYLFEDNFLLSIETEKDTQKKAIFKTGIEYNYQDFVFLRLGVSTNPFLTSYGIGFVWKNVNLDMAFSQHPILNYSSHISLNYVF